MQVDKSSFVGGVDGEHAHSQSVCLLRLCIVDWSRCRKAEDVVKSNSCKNRNDVASQSIDIEWHVYLGDTFVQRLRGRDLRVSQTRSFFVSMFNDITNMEKPKVQPKCPYHTEEVADCAARIRLGYWCFSGQGSEETLKYNEDRPSYQFADGGWDNLSLRMVNRLFISKRPCSSVSNILQTGALTKRKKGGGARTQ